MGVGQQEGYFLFRESSPEFPHVARIVQSVAPTCASQYATSVKRQEEWRVNWLVCFMKYSLVWLICKSAAIYTACIGSAEVCGGREGKGREVDARLSLGQRCGLRRGP